MSIDLNKENYIIKNPMIALPFDDAAQQIRTTLRSILHIVILKGKVPHIKLGDLSGPRLLVMKTSSHIVLILTKVACSVRSEKLLQVSFSSAHYYLTGATGLSPAQEPLETFSPSTNSLYKSFAPSYVTQMCLD